MRCRTSASRLPPRRSAALLEALNGHLLRRADEERITALVIDEAQNLSDETFEELRLLSNFETYTRKLLQIVLVGQPELQERLQQPAAAPAARARERAGLRQSALAGARWRSTSRIACSAPAARSIALFTPRALRIIVRRTGGIPRRANILCHNALLFAFGRNLDRVTHAEAREAVAEMDERRPGRSAPAPALRRRVLASAAPVGVRRGRGLHSPRRVVVAGGRDASSAPASREPAGSRAAVPTPEPRRARGVRWRRAPRRRRAGAGDGAPVTYLPETEPAVARHGTAARGPGRPSRRGRTRDGGRTRPRPRSVVVPRGGALWTILRNVYGEPLRDVRPRRALSARPRAQSAGRRRRPDLPRRPADAARAGADRGREGGRP